MMERKLILYYGDIAPEYLSGTSISAKNVLEELRNTYRISHIAEADVWTHHGRLTFAKIFNLVQKLWSVLTVSYNRKPQLFYLHLPSSTVGALKVLFLMLANRIAANSRIILHLHRGDYGRHHRSSVIFRLITKAIDTVADRILVLSNDHFESLRNIFIRSELIIVENTIDFEPSFCERKLVASCRFLFLSNYVREKGVLELLKVFRSILNDHNDVKLRLRGNTFDKEFLSILSLYDNGNSIVLEGPVSGSEKLFELCNADCLVLPSWNEGQPLVILEAMALGLPVIATDVGFVRETLGKTYPYLVPPKDENALFRSVKRFIGDERKEEIGKQLKERFQSKFSRKQHRQKIFRAFSEVCPPDA